MGNLEINQIMSKKILTESKGYLGEAFTHSLNPYAGCSFGCMYCYVRTFPQQVYKDIPWGEWIDIKTNAAELYKQEIKKLKNKNKPTRIFMSTATDPYQPVERKAGVTRALIEAMIECPPDFLLIHTRSPYILRDINVIKTLSERCELRLGITVETDRDDIRKIFEPKAPSIGIRLKTLKTLHDAGIRTQASVSPILPCTKEFPKVFEGIVDKIAIDSLDIGKRSEKLGMPELFKKHNLEKWYVDDLHFRGEQLFLNHYPKEMIGLIGQGFAP